MSFRGSFAEVARRAFVAISRGTLVKADDSKKWQEVTLRAEIKRLFSHVEVAHPYGFTAVGLPPADDQTSEAAELIVAYLDGDMSHPVALVVGDRRYRLKNLKDGEVAIYDDQGQKVHLTRDGITVYSPKPITVQSDEKIIHQAPKIILNGNVYLGGDDSTATRLVSAIGTVDTGGFAEVSNPLTKVYGL